MDDDNPYRPPVEGSLKQSLLQLINDRVGFAVVAPVIAFVVVISVCSLSLAIGLAEDDAARDRVSPQATGVVKWKD